MTFEQPFSDKRQVIPRWHTYPVARWLGMAMSTGEAKPPQEPSQAFLEKVQAWKEERCLSYAADLVGSALVLHRLDSVDAREAAHFIVTQDHPGMPSVVEVAEVYLRQVNQTGWPLPHIILPEHKAKFHEVIATLKRRVRDYPRNPILWMDLAFYYSAVGQTVSAAKAVTVALSLNNENRYLLRSGSRCFMHLGAPDQGLELIRRSELGRHDPWLIAAEIAIADTLGLPSKRMKMGRDLLASGRIPKFHLSELASAMGTIELAHGALKKGKRLFNLALEDPTENTIAQAAYLANILGETASQIHFKKLANSFEAETRLKFYQDEDYKGALDAAKKWFAYQPFSARPALSGSYIASVALEDYEDAVRITTMGLLSSPQDVMLRNNLAFSLACLSRSSEAREVLLHLKETDLSKRDLSVITATKALIDFRSGNLTAGRQLYEASIAGFKQLKDIRAETMARFFWAREEWRANPQMPRQLLEEALTGVSKLGIKELRLMRRNASGADEILF